VLIVCGKSIVEEKIEIEVEMRENCRGPSECHVMNGLNRSKTKISNVLKMIVHESKRSEMMRKHVSKCVFINLVTLLNPSLTCVLSEGHYHFETFFSLF